MTVQITVAYPDEREQEILGFTFGEANLTAPEAEEIRPKIEFALSRLFMAKERCSALIEIANRRRDRT